MKIAVNEDGHVLEQIKTHPKEVEKEDARVAGAHKEEKEKGEGAKNWGRQPTK